MFIRTNQIEKNGTFVEDMCHKALIFLSSPSLAMNWKSVSYGPFLYSVGDDSSLPPSPIPPENDVISQEILIP